ncbi:DUF4625 domain-containing protein [Draconibacterium sediminis]|uniref:DUF4625 domain-containing protein n=1 Tax=Draconibacterium sediminis TaxID=1544798 RepID=UPI0025D2CF40|nr:DUF4625 domain-containing protein [Draconibacterium sediminis]
MKTKAFFTFLVITVIFFAACQKDPSPPVITILELGDGDTHGNDHTAKIGGDLHMEVEVVAEGKIDKIQVRVHPEGEHQEEGEHEEWEIDTTYTKFSGLKNTTFHEHLEIDLSAEPGDYHFDFIVTDMEGNQSDAEADLKIIEE